MGNVCPWCGQHIDPQRKVWIFNDPDTPLEDAQIYHFACGMRRQHAMKNPHICFSGRAYEEVSAGRWREVELDETR